MNSLVKKIYTRAIQLAKLTKSANKSNPKVGCLIFDANNNIISEGYHKAYGSYHAERMAFNACQDMEKLKKDASVMVTLEPCNHYGKTPPCLELIIHHKINKTFVAVKDPNPLMSGKSLDKLKEENLSFEIIINNKDALKLLETFAINQKFERPFIRLKIATDNNGVYADSNKRLLITDPCSHFFSHQLRAHSNAILVGWKTVQQDNPKLTNRLAGGTSPLRVVIDRNQRLSSAHYLFSDSSPTLYVTNAYRNDLPKWVDQFSPTGEGKIWLQSLLAHLLKDFQIGTLLVEGGATTLDYFIKEELWDELYVFQSANNCKNIEQALYFTLPPSRLEQSINLVNDRLNLYKPVGREN